MSSLRTLSHQDAGRIIDTVRLELEANRLGAAIAIVDPHGELLAFLRTDGCRLPSIHIAINKAYTAAREQIESGGTGQTIARRRLSDDQFRRASLRHLGRRLSDQGRW